MNIINPLELPSINSNSFNKNSLIPNNNPTSNREIVELSNKREEEKREEEQKIRDKIREEKIREEQIRIEQKIRQEEKREEEKKRDQEQIREQQKIKEQKDTTIKIIPEIISRLSTIESHLKILQNSVLLTTFTNESALSKIQSYLNIIEKEKSSLVSNNSINNSINKPLLKRYPSISDLKETEKEMNLPSFSDKVYKPQETLSKIVSDHTVSDINLKDHTVSDVNLKDHTVSDVNLKDQTVSKKNKPSTVNPSVQSLDLPTIKIPELEENPSPRDSNIRHTEHNPIYKNKDGFISSAYTRYNSKRKTPYQKYTPYQNRTTYNKANKFPVQDNHLNQPFNPSFNKPFNQPFNDDEQFSDDNDFQDPFNDDDDDNQFVPRKKMATSFKTNKMDW